MHEVAYFLSLQSWDTVSKGREGVFDVVPALALEGVVVSTLVGMAAVRVVEQGVGAA